LKPVCRSRSKSASKFGWIGVFRQLVELANLDLDAQDNEGNTALIHAAQAGHYEVVELILRQSVNVDQRNHRGFSALMKAAIQGQIETVRFLLAQGADHSITDPTRGMCAQGKSVDPCGDSDHSAALLARFLGATYWSPSPQGFISHFF
jgi:hypothetical protein